MIHVEDMTSAWKGRNVWVIGDVHGRFDLLQQLLQAIRYDPAADAIAQIGDVLDRGSEPLLALDFLQANAHVQMGNHEWMWLEIFAKYGNEAEALADIYPALLTDGRDATWQALRRRGWQLSDLAARIEHLPVATVFEDWLLVHGGVYPGVSFHDHEPEDLLWLREHYYLAPSIPSESCLGKRIVSGHSVTAVIDPSRLGHIWEREDRVLIDIGAGADLGLAAYSLTTQEHAVVYTEKGQRLLRKGA